MSINRRQFIQLLGIASASGIFPSSVFSAKKQSADLYEIPSFGNVSLLHFTDTHAQLNPVYFREPNVNIGVGNSFGKVPHLVGHHLLKHFNISPDSLSAHAFSYLNYDTEAAILGKVGGFAHLATLIKRIRAERGENNTLLLDGGDTWQGSGTAFKTRGMDMVGACNLLGVDVMTGHWEFTYLEKEILANIEKFNGDFVAQNIFVKDEVSFDYQFSDFEGFNEDSGAAFKPYVIKIVNGHRVAVIGQAFPYTPIANPSRFIPDWTFSINDQNMQAVVDTIRENEKPDVVVLISHNGMDVDLKLASIVSGIDVIFGGHTHDGVPVPSLVKNPAGKTLVTNAGSNGKFLGVMDLEVKNSKVTDFKYRLLPVFSNLLPADKAMTDYIAGVRAPYMNWLNEELTVTEQTLYRRGNFNGTFDQVIVNALREQNDAQIALSPGFRWGTSLIPGQKITMEHVLDQTCITYPETYRREMSGFDLKLVLEDVCDNLFNTDPYFQQGGDMVRVGGMDYVCDPTQKMGHRISNMMLDNGQPVSMEKKYPVAGWATVKNKASGKNIWDVVANHLRGKDSVQLKKINSPKLVNVQGNPGIEDYLKV